MTNEQKKSAKSPSDGSRAPTTSSIRRIAASASGAAARLFTGDGWTTAVTLDDAFAPELLQTWSLTTEAPEKKSDAETDPRIVDLADAPALV
jgi:hypothetical protein